MGGSLLSEEDRRRTIDALKETQNADGTPNISKAARLLNVPRQTLQYRKDLVKDALIEYPAFVLEGDAEEDIDEILTRFKKQHKREKEAAAARQWFTIKVNETKPYGLLWFGDPHLGPHCNWDALERDVEICSQDGVYAGNVGDTTDNWPWTGRLARLWAENDISKKTERRLATWFMKEAGIKWLVWIGGNHDEWNGGLDFYKWIGAAEIPVIDWRARFRIQHRNGSSVRIDAAHGRKGTSIYNPAHGSLRDAKFGEDADMFVTGHIHSYGLFDIEFPEKRTRTWLAQISGYKINDRYALVNGFAESQYGQSVFTVINPQSGKLQCFGDAVEGAAYLAWLRNKA
jgi:hypothetical protein